jgi:hypothetical protein
LFHTLRESTKAEGVQEQGAKEEIWAQEKAVTGWCRKLHELYLSPDTIKVIKVMSIIQH